MPAIPDEHVVRVLRPFVAATGPVLRGLRDADPFRLGRLARRRALELQQGGHETAPVPTTRRGKVGRAFRTVRARVLDRLATSKLPGTPRWQAMSPEERDRWWVSRVGRFTSVVASIPGIGGALARRLPVSDILGLAAQGLVVCAIASEHGMDGRDEQVRLLASVLFGRDVDPRRHGDPHAADVEREAGELAGAVSTEREERGHLSALASALWRMGKTLWGLQGELDRRPQGNRFWRALANLPVVGALASYRSERSGLKRAARAAARWVAREQGRA
ncbi:hypothetical protein [Actinomycetospora lemnae]|uniref:EcsC family protein n=1 Tax=Actinomycetospora lemnae TaxID=3019891 RepID=A0ABT5SQG2_9PSEU|nr:hypothetical protein [Actinomycetospora sp. DW7H6]MDD7965085.1 hypothetical protein [Actinomycetospora sp. DW7H6]